MIDACLNTRRSLFVLVAILFVVSLAAMSSAQETKLGNKKAPPRALDEAAELAYEANPHKKTKGAVSDQVAAPPAGLDAQKTIDETATRSMAVTRAVAGPDGFGYRSIDSAEAGGPAFGFFIDISGSGTFVVNGDDASSTNTGINGPIVLGAPFTLYGVTYTELTMAANGYITTDTTDTGPDLSNDCPLPASPSSPAGTTGARIYPLHDDLDLEAGIGNGYYQYFTVCPRQNDLGCDMGCHVFMWDDVSHFPGGGGAATWDMEAILYDNGDIVFLVGAGNPETGSGSTTGIQSEAPGDGNPPSFGLTHVCDTAGSIPDDFAVRIFLDTDGDGVPDNDSDGDGVGNTCDNCPTDPSKLDPGECGCGNPDTDTDGDGVADCNDNCPADPNKTDPGQCGCGNPDTDTDGDGVADCNDNCPDDPDKLDPGACGCGNPDTDADGNGTPDCLDPPPPPAGQTSQDCCGGGVPMMMPFMLMGWKWGRRRNTRRKSSRRRNR